MRAAIARVPAPPATGGERVRVAGRLGMRVVDLISDQPWLADGLPPERVEPALPRARARAAAVRRGRWDPTTAWSGDGFGLLVLRGTLMRRAEIPGGCVLELLGEGDLLQPGADGGHPDGCEVEWTIAGEIAAFAVLDEAFCARTAPFPWLGERLLCHVQRRADRLAVLLALRRQPRIEWRLLLLFWHLAARWGTVTPEGTLLHLPRLTHRALGEMVGARRPSVTSAMSALCRSGRLRRSASGGWMLAGPPPNGSLPQL